MFNGTDFLYNYIKLYPTNAIFRSANINAQRAIALLQKHTNPLVAITRRTFTTDSISTKRQLYLSLVRSQLTYYSIIWRPHLSKHIVVLEKVQKCATKFILNDYSLSYKNRLIAIHLLPLMYQFELNDLMFFIQSLC